MHEFENGARRNGMRFYGASQRFIPNQPTEDRQQAEVHVAGVGYGSMQRLSILSEGVPVACDLHHLFITPLPFFGDFVFCLDQKDGNSHGVQTADDCPVYIDAARYQRISPGRDNRGRTA